MSDAEVQAKIDAIDDLELKGRNQIYAHKYPHHPVWFGLLSLLAIAYATFVVASVITLYWPPYEQLAITFMGGMILTFLIIPTFKRNPRSRLGYAIDAVLSLGAIATGLYVYTQYNEFVWRIGVPNQNDIILGTIAILLVLEGARRTVGWAMPVIMAVCFAYVYWGKYFPGIWRHGGIPFKRIVENQFLTVDGIFGLPLNTFVNFVFLFMVFGCIMEFVGASKFFTDIAVAIAGRYSGGPAKVAVISSAIFGSVSGSAVANVAGTGAFTIPLMKKTGFPPHIAGAVEAAASTGGQIMPPVMGAVAFMMADLLQIPYGQVALAAALPALLYFLSVGLAVHFMARQLGLKGAPPELIRPARTVLREGWYYLAPLVVITLVLTLGYSATAAAKWGITSTIVLGLISRNFWAGLPLSVLLVDLARRFPGQESLTLSLGKSLLPALAVAAVVVLVQARQRGAIWRQVQTFCTWSWQALEKASLTAVSTVAAVACSGIITGLFVSSGLGLRIADLIVQSVGGSLFFTLVLAALLALVLGMGVPTLVTYILVAVMVAPGIVKLGVPPLLAHLFLAYFGIFAMVTPPVAMAAYTGAAIAGADMWKTGWKAFRLSLAGFLVPFIFVYEPALALMGSPLQVVGATLSALVGTIALAAAAAEYLVADNNGWERVALYAAAVMLIKPGLYTDMAGLAVLLAVYLLQKRRSRALATAAA